MHVLNLWKTVGFFCRFMWVYHLAIDEDHSEANNGDKPSSVLTFNQFSFEIEVTNGTHTTSFRGPVFPLRVPPTEVTSRLLKADC